MPSNHYRRATPSLPDPSTLPFPGNLVRGCSDCSLRAGCKAPVPGEGPTPAAVMLVGEGPGINEDEQGHPFVGSAGRYLDSLLFSIGLPRESVFITNVVHCRPPNNRDPKSEEMDACRRWLDSELGLVSPKIVVAMGATAISRFLGSDAGTVEHLHGRPVELDGRIVLPAYHPAAALYDTSLLRQCQEDFQVLRGLLRGVPLSEYHVQDEFPNPDYRVADTPSTLRQMVDELHDAEELAVDTEQVSSKLWSVQFSTRPGTAWFLPIKSGYAEKVDLSRYPGTVIVHNYLYDVRWLGIPDSRFLDTMTLAYLCVARDTPILKSDLTWSRADAVHVGDSLVGFDESYGGVRGNAAKSTKGFTRRHLRKTVVEKVGIRNAACSKVTLSDGRSVVCTQDHQWLVSRLGSKRLEWLTVSKIAQRMVSYVRGGPYGGKPAQYRIRSLVPGSWETDLSYDAGWLSGVIDGEGCLSIGSGGDTSQFSISQRAGDVLDKAVGLLRTMGFSPAVRMYRNHGRSDRPVYAITMGRTADIMELLGRVRPVRMNMDFWLGRAFSNNGDVATIVSVEPVGEQEVVSITTSTGTYIANGLASHNCGMPQGLKELASRLCGIKMQSYPDLVRPGQQAISVDYLSKASKTEWPAPPPIAETKWDSKKGEVFTRTKKPWHISRKITKLLADLEEKPSTNPYKRWNDIPAEERAVVEGMLGAMPESSLADIPYEDAVRYAARDPDATLRVYHVLKKRITEMGLDFVLRMDTDTLPLANSMMATGMAVDLDHLLTLSKGYTARMRDGASELASTVGHSFNPNSSNQVATVVYGELGFKPTKFTPTKEISTDDQELKKTGHPVAKGVIEYRRLSKMKGTYADALVEWAVLDSAGVPRVHTTLKTTRVATGRWSSESPNLQNIPIRSREGKAVKNGFVAPEGKILGEADLGQIEVRTQAHVARCRGLIDLFQRGLDPHTSAASHIFGVPYEDAKQEKYRYPTKRANFGVIYMIGAKGLASQIAEYISDLEMEGEKVDISPWSVEDCDKFISDWYKLYPEVKDYQLEQAAQARRHGYVRDIFGRIRYIPEVSCPINYIQEGGLRMAANMPVTSSAQGIIKLAMGRLWRELPNTPWANDVTYLMQIHDSLVFELPEEDSYVRSCLAWVRQVMVNTVQLLVPVTADVKVGKRWGEMKKLDLGED